MEEKLEIKPKTSQNSYATKTKAKIKIFSKLLIYYLKLNKFSISIK